MDGSMHDGEAKHMQASEVSDHAEGLTSGAQGRDQIRVWKGGFYLAYVVPIKAGEDIYEKTVTYFQDREKFPACFQGHPCMATILSVTGCVSNPMLELGGSAICFEGSRPVLSMSGLFSVDKDGQAHQRGKLQITFPNADGHIFGGPVTGSLTAATPMQVTVSFFTCEEEEEGEEEEEEEEEDEEEEEEEEEEQEQEEE